MRLFASLNPLPPIRRLTRMLFRQDAWRYVWSPRSAFNYQREVGDGTGSSTVMAPVQWVARNFPEAPPALWLKDAEGQEKQVHDHPLLRLLERPNDYYTGESLMMATCVDYLVDGNAYWLKIRSPAGYPVELWWVPHWMMRPIGTETEFISYYEYWTGNNGPTVNIDPADVVHFRYGLDGNDPRKGYSPLKSVLREVFTDDEAANMTASLLRNMGVPGLIVSPANATITPKQAQTTKDALIEMFTGDRKGEPWVATGATKVEQFGFSPQDLSLRDLRQINEERVSGVLGVPAIVAGFGAGLARSTFTNFVEARSAAYDSALIPMQRVLAKDIKFQLLEDFERDTFLWRFGFDLAEVAALRDDHEKQFRMWIAGFLGGVVQRSEVRRKFRMTVDPDGADDVYLQPLHSVLLPEGEVFTNPAEATSRNPGDQTAPPPPTQPPAATNGHGADFDAVVEAVTRQLTAD